MEQFKKAEFLEVGKVYADKPSHDKRTTYLKFIGSDPDRANSMFFEYVSGDDNYLRHKNGLIGFLASIQEVSPGVFSYEFLDFFVPTQKF